MSGCVTRRGERYFGVGVRAGLIGALLVCGPAGCGSQDGANQEAAPAGPIVKTAERGPVHMTVTAEPGELTIADRLTLSVEVSAEEGVDVEMPEFGKDLTAFAIRDFREAPVETVDGKRRWRQEYVLDIFLSGVYPVPELTAHFTDRRKGEENVVESSVSTEPFEVNVRSLVEGEFDPTKFRGLKPPVEIPISRSWAWAGWGLAGLAAAAVVALIGWWVVRRMRRPSVEFIMPAHEWAFAELRRLADAKLVEQEQVHEFYYRLSMIVRMYIERRFRLMAPERTTEEFLVEVQRDQRLSADHRATLGAFLSSCDMVKFALYQPGTREIEQAFDAARDFIEETADRAPRTEPERKAA